MWLHLLRAASVLPIALAAYLDSDPDKPRRIIQRGSAVGPALVVLTTGAVLLWDPDGQLRWVMIAGGAATLSLAVARLLIGVREADSYAERLRRSEVDLLTGLPSQVALKSLGAHQVRHSALVVLGLDMFRDVNNTVGYDGGDRVLAVVADRLRLETRVSDLLFRVGGDGLAVLLAQTNAEEAVVVAEGLVRRIEDPIVLDGLALHVTACAGVAADAHEEAGVGYLIACADAALNSAKSTGPGTVHAFAVQQVVDSQGQLLRRAAISESFDSGGADFVIHYQPIVSIHDGGVLAVEALVRWRYNGQVLAPGDFLPDLIRAGQMPRLTEMMLHKSLRELREHDLPYPVTINVQGEFIDQSLTGVALAAVAASGSDPAQLILEITEDVLIRGPVTSGAVPQALRAGGVRVLVDHFGTGLSGLVSLRELAVDGLKIDRSFVSLTSVDVLARPILDQVATMAEELGLVVIFEGAEDAAVVTMLETLDAGYIQGFAIARPMPIEDLVQWSSLRGVPPMALPPS